MAKFTKATLQAIVKDALGPEIAELRSDLIARSGEKTTADVTAAIKAGQSGTALAQRASMTKAQRLELIQTKSNFGAFVLAYAQSAKAGKSLGDAAKRAEKWGFPEVAKALNEGDVGEGGALVPTEFSSEFIELLRPETVLMRAGSRIVPMDRELLDMGRQTAASTFEWVGESQNVAPSQQSTDKLILRARKGRVLVPVSNDLLRDSARPAEAFIRDDMVLSAAEGVDLAGIRGTGSEFSPKGIRFTTTAGNVFARTGATIVSKVNDLVKAVRVVDESDVSLRKGAWLMSPRTFWHLFGLLDDNNNFIFRPELSMGMLFGFPVFRTTQIPTNLGGPADETEIYFVEMLETMFGDSLQAQVEIFPGGAYDDSGTVRSGISRDETVLALTLRTDFAMRHPEAAAIITGVDWGA